MKCALIIPAWIPEEIFSSKTAGSQINYWQPLGTLYVASSILKAGHDVTFLNGAFMTHSEILQNVSEYKPDFVGLYSTTFGWKKAVQTTSDIRWMLKRLTPSIILPLNKGRSKEGLLNPFIVVGGPYP
ncbi:MAG: cobalamin B12-binding domain-containing protein, partial [Thermodesulfovibrionia bacterium]|nr:cobalamin B12-binding domain-containing protein [Thermodesulfovibrionia bacterium]